MGDLNFDANEHEPQSFDALPAGWYAAILTSAKWRQTKAGTGEYLEFSLQVTKGRYQNRKLFARLNLKNPNPQAVQIANGELSSICRAVGVLTPQDSSELLNKPLLVRVKVRDYQGEPRNETAGFKALTADWTPDSGSAATTDAVPQPPAEAVAAAGDDDSPF